MTGTGAAPAVLRIVAAVVVREGRFLLVRKRGTQAFMQVGGKIEPGEEPLAALVREVAEEIGVLLDPGAVPATVRPLGRFTAEAANEPGHVVDAHAFEVDLPAGSDPQPQAELEDLVWVDPAAPVTPYPIAPLSLDLIARAGGVR
ncbi:DNA mismatch repair protein MutT [Xylanimonas oleitrophica]|uniref:DNA mismatch repair protein MutT n=1 Tax=Xylanimonas oleitrophica TaxID=2607479 RepID=A0A2W5WLP7_9MICO|nr:NUDIX domain-containing protein [Xylanimonas oleitrophica]PZR52120.1 DNA mismatch repair protein MutT [Xylanimonas oleitrophica]